jgi:hypothetical protein
LDDIVGNLSRVEKAVDYIQMIGFFPLTSRCWETLTSST